MPFISVTRLRLRTFRTLPLFAFHSLRALGQAKRARGFRGGALLADRSLTFWTLTAWQDRASMRDSIFTGSHRTAMPYLLAWCDEASVAHWDQAEDAMPSWPEADRRMRSEGRASKVLHPSPDHAALAFRPPRLTLRRTLHPIHGA